MHHLPSRYIPCDGRLTASAYFKSTLPAWGATDTIITAIREILFQSTLPVGGATMEAIANAALSYISIHAPRGGSDSLQFGRK